MSETRERQLRQGQLGWQLWCYGPGVNYTRLSFQGYPEVQGVLDWGQSIQRETQVQAHVACFPRNWWEVTLPVNGKQELVMWPCLVVWRLRHALKCIT